MKNKILAFASAVIISFSMIFTAAASGTQSQTDAYCKEAASEEVSPAVIIVLTAGGVVVAVGIAVAARKKD